MTAQYQAPLIPGTGGGNSPSSNPYFSQANQFLPRNLHDIIKWSRYITTQSPVTTEVIRKLSTYPITEFIVESGSEKIKERYQEIFTSFRLKSTLHNIGFEYYTLGNVFLSIFFPVMRTLTCKSCSTPYNAKAAEFTTFKQYGFHGKCPKCNHMGEFTRTDTKSLSVQDMNIIKWDPLNIATNHNPITGEYEYYYKIPNDVKRKIQTGDKLFVNSVPWGIIEAVKNNQDFKFDRDSIYHLKNISAGQQVGGVAIPPIISLFSLVFYQATLRKANESISTDFMNPMRVIYPMPQTGSSDPVVSISMRNFVSNMEDAITKHKRDKNHVLIAPVPVGYQAISGEGKNLLVSQEIQQAEESILLSLGVSRELLSGTTNWTSSTVGLRMLENTMFVYIEQILGFVNWAMSRSSKYLSLETCKIGLTPFRLTDDDNMRQILMNMVGTQAASMSSLYESMGMDYDKELKKMQEDAIAKAVSDVKTKMAVDKAVFMASKESADKFDKESDYKTALAKAQQLTEDLMQADPTAQRQGMNELRVNNYAMYLMVTRLMEEYASSPQGQQEASQEGMDTAGGPSKDSNKDAGTDKPTPADKSKPQSQPQP